MRERLPPPARVLGQADHRSELLTRAVVVEHRDHGGTHGALERLCKLLAGESVDDGHLVGVGVRVRVRVRVVRARLCEGVDDGHRLLPGHELLRGRLLLLVIDPLL